MKTGAKTFHEAYPECRWVYPHAACVRMGSFRRSWVQPSLSEENWDQAGVLYYDETGTVTYGTVVRVEHLGVTSWRIQRERRVDGQFKPDREKRTDPLPEAIERLMAEVRASRELHGPVPVEEWPPDSDSSWIVFSATRRNRS